jgi:predicted metal-dependent hydrolase
MDVEIIRSSRRARTISARVVDGRLVVRVPAGLEPAEEQRWVERLSARIARQQARQRLRAADAHLAERARALSERYFGGALRPTAIRYVTNQEARYGSCTTSRGEIRLSHRLADYPAWVLDYVIVHELAHLQEPNHGPRFWKLVNRYPLAERARGFLIAKGLEPDEPS